MTEPTPQPKTPEVAAEVLPPETPRLSRKQTASFLGCTTRTVDRLHREGKLASLNGAGKVPMFSRDEVVELARVRRAHRYGIVKVDHEEPTESQAKAVAANVFADLVAGTQGHTEEFAKLALTATQKLLDQAHTSAKREQDAAMAREQRLQARIDKLEDERDAVLAAGEAQRKQLYDIELAKAEVAKKERMYEAGRDFIGLLAPGFAARLNPDAPNSMQIQKVGLKRIFARMTPERREELQTLIMSKLDPDEQMALAMLFIDEATPEERADAAKPRTIEVDPEGVATVTEDA